MKHSTIGRPRLVTDEQVEKLRAWKPFKELAKELGISRSRASWAKKYDYKKPSP